MFGIDEILLADILINYVSDIAVVFTFCVFLLLLEDTINSSKSKYILIEVLLMFHSISVALSDYCRVDYEAPLFAWSKLYVVSIPIAFLEILLFMYIIYKRKTNDLK